MIDHISISHFRCFASLEIKELRQINLLVGRNGSGKSAFMESLFLSSGSSAPRIAFQLRALRKIGGNLQVQGDNYSYKGLWEDLFYDFDERKKVSIKVIGNSGDSRSLTISYTDSSVQLIPYGKDPSRELIPFDQVTFTWKRGNGREIVVKPRFTDKGLQLEGETASHLPMIWFTPGVESGEESAKRYSELSKRNEHTLVVETLCKEFEFIEGLSIEYFSGVPMIFAAVRGKKKKMPIGLVSDGVSRFLALLLGIAYFKGGVVLIDQLEDGFYFERLPSIWTSLRDVAQQCRTQLFISTHSGECLRAIRPALKDHEDRFRLLRAERGEAECTISSIEGDLLEMALEQEFEVR
jgi:AAA15 family ATPase/GTPase